MSEPYRTPGIEDTDKRAKGYDPESSDRDSRWWLKTGLEQADCVAQVMERIWKQQVWRRESYQRYLRMYNNMAMSGWGSRLTEKGPPPTTPRLSLNVVKSCSDSFTAKMTLERPKCTFLTSGGDWSLQQKAKDLEKFVDGQFYEMKLYEVMPRIVLDACVTGTGVYKIFIDGKGEDACVSGEQINAWELGVDELDGQYGTPRCLYQKKIVNRIVLMEMFPEQSEEIGRAETFNDENPLNNFQDTTSDMVEVHMCWHLPSGKSAKDGRYFMGLSKVPLCNVEWSYDYFPFVFYRRMPALMGFWGIGLAEELMGIQQDINMMIQRAQRAIYMMATPKWWVSTNTKIAIGQLTNDIDIVRSTEPPQVLLPGAVMPPDFWQQLERQYQRSFEICGVNQLQAQAQKPAGLNSGKALDTYADIASEHFAVASRNYQDLILECARQVIDRAREITAEDNPKYSVIAISKNASQSVAFLKTDLKREEAVLQMFPTNMLAKDPSERMAQVEQMVNSGLIDPNDAPRLLEFPDLEQEWNLKYASYNLCMKMIDSILNEGTMIQPRPFMNLKEARKWGQLRELQGELQGCPEANLQMLREWIQTVDELDQKANPPPPPPPMPGMGPPPPGGPPGMPPGPPPPPGIPPGPDMNGAPPPPMAA